MASYISNAADLDNDHSYYLFEALFIFLSDGTYFKFQYNHNHNKEPYNIRKAYDSKLLRYMINLLTKDDQRDSLKAALIKCSGYLSREGIITIFPITY